jgi:hypothetical protein
MPAGCHGEFTSRAIRSFLKPGEVVTFSVLYGRVRQKGPWSEHTIWRHLTACLVNPPPARHEWPSTQPFLLLHEDGTYELYNPRLHPRVRE